MNERLLIISVAPEPYHNKISNIRRFLCYESCSYASLQFPPHITLAPLRILKGALNSALREIKSIRKSLKKCEINVTGISYHDYIEGGKLKYTIRLAVAPNSQLSEVHKKLKEINGNSNTSKLGKDNHHTTLLFGDLTEKEY